uniref:Uncharacterized protein n=1 Tax=Bursaphelenchus xylophilus TaxID=6326 RepID=A0A1I7SH62_BURXY
MLRDPETPVFALTPKGPTPEGPTPKGLTPEGRPRKAHPERAHPERAVTRASRYPKKVEESSYKSGESSWMLGGRSAKARRRLGEGLQYANFF